MPKLTILSGSYPEYIISVDDPKGWYGHDLRLEGYGDFILESDYRTVHCQPLQRIILLQKWEGSERVPEVGTTISYTLLPRKVPNCCDTGPYYQWRFRGYSYPAKYVGPPEDGWVTSACVTSGHGAAWNITHCGSCHALLPLGPPDHMKPEARSRLLGLLKLRPEKEHGKV